MKKILSDKQVFEILDKRTLPKASAKNTEGELPSFLNLSVSADGKRATLAIYDEISWWSGNDARSFRETLKGLDVETIEVRINSPGGSVFEGIAIHNMLVSHPAKIETHNDGLAASIASVIFLAGEDRHIAENAMVMIHNPTMGLRGTADDFRHYAGVLDKVKDSILATYVSTTSMSKEDLAEAMNSDTYYTAAEALANGFATTQTEPMKVAALWNPEDHKELPAAARALANFKDEPPAKPPATHPAAPPSDPKPEAKGTPEDVTAAAAKIAALRKAHGL